MTYDMQDDTGGYGVDEETGELQNPDGKVIATLEDPISDEDIQKGILEDKGVSDPLRDALIDAFIDEDWTRIPPDEE